MIKNIVFDLGRVLVDFVPDGYLRSLGFGNATVQALQEKVFGPYWRFYDRGDFASITDLREFLVEKYPEYAVEIHRTLRTDWVRMHTLKPDSAAYLHELKKRGYRIFILSNLAKESYEFVSGYDFFTEVDGGVFSYQERVIKPDEKIYHILLDRYALLPEETLFFDDNAENIAAAQRIGIHGILFTTLPEAKAQAEKLL